MEHLHRLNRCSNRSVMACLTRHLQQWQGIAAYAAMTEGAEQAAYAAMTKRAGMTKRGAGDGGNDES